jgi:hypothetical protein
MWWPELMPVHWCIVILNFRAQNVPALVLIKSLQHWHIDIMIFLGWGINVVAGINAGPPVHCNFEFPGSECTCSGFLTSGVV